MKITNNQAFSAQNYLSELKLGKFDKDTRLAIYKNVGELSVVVKSIQEKIEASKKELFKGLDEQVQKVNALRSEFAQENVTNERKMAIVQEISQYEDVLKTEREFNDVVNSFGNDEVEVNIQQVNFDNFIMGLVDSDIDFTSSSLQRIAFMFNE